MRFPYSSGDEARLARRWSAQSAAPDLSGVALAKTGGVTAAGAHWTLKEQ